MAEIHEKLIYTVVKKLVFEKLGTLKNELSSWRDLSKDEKAEALPIVTDMIERASREFVAEMRQRQD